MSCWQRPDWAQVFECAYDYLAEPVYIELPRGIWVLFLVGVGAVIGWLLVYIPVRVFGNVALDYIAMPFKLIANAVAYPFTMYSLWRFRRQVTAAVRAQAEEGIDLDEAEKALAERWKEGE